MDNSYRGEETPRGVPPGTSSQAIIGYYGMHWWALGTPIPYMAAYTGTVPDKYIDSRCVCSNADVPQNSASFERFWCVDKMGRKLGLLLLAICVARSQGARSFIDKLSLA